jgi:hypothetical protein
MTTPEQIQRAEAVEILARKVYDRSVARNQPAWDVADPAVKFHIMERVNESVNEVLEIFTPAAPELQGLLMQLEMHMAELRRMPLLSGAQAAQALLATIDLATDYGSVRKKGG